MNSQSNTIASPFSFSFPSTFSSVSLRPYFNFATSTVEKMDYVTTEDQPVPMDWTPEPVPMEWSPESVLMEWSPESVPMDWTHAPFSIEYDENGFDPDL